MSIASILSCLLFFLVYVILISDFMVLVVVIFNLEKIFIFIDVIWVLVVNGPISEHLK